MLIDDVTITIKAGDGGNGAVHFIRNAMTAKGGPDGGNGGNGADIYFQGSQNLSDLQEFTYKKKVRALDGISGKGQKLFGKNGDDTTVFVPLGTTITHIESGKTYEITDETTRVLLAKGGVGGRGNTEFKTSTHQAPTYAEEGTLGEEKTLRLNLRLIADIGLMGLPNAGKSSLLQKLTNATPKIGNYAFTTLEPNLGVMNTGASKKVLADIPGLIEGASKGKGLGIQFLKHIEKTKLLLHCIDATSIDPIKSYEVVRKELEQHNKQMLKKEEIILLTKTDLLTRNELVKIVETFKKMKKDVRTISIYNEEDIQNLKDFLNK